MFIIFFIALLRPIKTILIDKVNNNLPSEVIKIVNKEVKTSTSLANFFSKKSKNVDIQLGITNQQIKQISQWKEISRINKTQVLQKSVAVSLEHPLLSLLGGGIYFDALFQGIDKSLVRNSLICMKNFKPQKKIILDANGKTHIKQIKIPLVIPAIYADIAKNWLLINQLPQVDLKKFVGLELTLKLGKSYFFRKQTTKANQQNTDTILIGKICGFVPEGLVTTIGAPLGWVQNIHKENKMKKALNSFDQIFVKVNDPKKISSFTKKVKKMNLKISKEVKGYNKLYDLLNKIDYILWGISAFLLFISFISLFNSFFSIVLEKKYELGLYLVFGSSSVFLVFLLFIHGSMWGMIHSFGSLYLAELSFKYIKENLNLIPFFYTFNLESLSFDLKSSEKNILVIGITLLSGLSSFIPAIFLIYKKNISLIKK